MSDRELLELAAKAAGISYSKYRPDGWLDTRGLWVDGRRWSPLEDDGDRYRLARKLKGNLYFSGRRGVFEIPSDSDEPPIVEKFKLGDPREEAYAIVRAAAEIWREQQ